MKSIVLIVSITSLFLVVVECLNPLDILKTCVADSQCKANEEFCDHEGINPIGSCRKGYELGAKCHFDRHCASKKCHLTHCVARKPVKDGPCTRDQHNECIETQYCVKDKNSKAHKCTDRACSGWCFKHAQCLSNRCNWLFRCTAPSDGCK